MTCCAIIDIMTLQSPSHSRLGKYLLYVILGVGGAIAILLWLFTDYPFL